MSRSPARVDVARAVRDVLCGSRGRPLDPLTRRRFARRFHTDFRDVRIHADSTAARAAALLGARAFTVGPHVVFGRGEYRPHTPAGGWLLAHELTHVVQQRTAIPRVPCVLGRPDDPAEREADVVASRVMAGLDAPAIAPRAEAEVRRAVRIHSGSAGIDEIKGQVRPGLALLPGNTSQVAVANLTHNFNPDPTKVDWAFELLGHVKVALGAGDNLASHTFGFVQYLRHKFTGIFYAGRRRQEGSIGMLLDPVITTAYLLDCSPATRRPFMWLPAPRSTFDSGSGEVTARMGDHPVLSIKQRDHNVTTGVDNYLYQIVDDREAWSVFTVLGPSGTFQHLAHVHWTLRYEFRLVWRGGTPVVDDRSRFHMDPAAAGAPKDANLAPVLALLSASQLPIANEQTRKALRLVVVPPNPHRSDNPGWFAGVPQDFYR